MKDENRDIKKLKDLLPFIAYNTPLQLMEIGRERKKYVYLFSKDDLIFRETIEKSHPELLDRELSDGISIR